MAGTIYLDLWSRLDRLPFITDEDLSGLPLLGLLAEEVIANLPWEEEYDLSTELWAAEVIEEVILGIHIQRIEGRAIEILDEILRLCS